MLMYFNSLHRGEPRKIQHGQKIHNSLLLSSKYTSKASPPSGEDPRFWTLLQGIAQGSKTQENSSLYETWVELDLYDHIKDALQQFLGNPSASSKTIKELAKRGRPLNIYMFIL